MNNIISQVCQQFIKEVLDFFGQEKSLTLGEIETRLTESTHVFIKDMMKTYLEEIDQKFKEDKVSRKQKGLVVERRNDRRTIYTKFGTMTYARSYYFNKRKKTYVYPVDQVAGIEGYERISLKVAAELVGHAAEASYGESSRHITGEEISRQTVMKKIRKTKGLQLSAPQEKRKLEVLYIDADEDHVALQDGSNTIVPIVTVHEGIKKECKHRNKCINAHHICAYGKKPEDLWLKVANWIDDVYDEDTLKTIYIHGDGASWIKKGLDELAKAKLVLDKYHLNKSIIKATGAQPRYRGEIRQALREADQKKFKRLVKDMIKEANSENEQKRIKEFRQYVANNWQGIEIYKLEDCGGSSAEAHVSHVLSARMSSRPMGWSREGLKYMARLRTFYVNGGVVGVEHIKTKNENNNLVKKAMKRAQKAFKNVDVSTLGNLVAIDMGKVTPLFRALRAIPDGGIKI